MAEKEIMGCDIGNAYAYASVADSDDRDPEDLMPEEYKRVGMPTTAFVPAESNAPIKVCDLRLGAPLKLMKKNPAQVVEAVKRCFSQNEITLKESGPKGKTIRTVTPEEVYAAIVRDLVTMANAVRVSIKRPPIYDLVFTYPAAFLGENRIRERMQEAIESVIIDGQKLHVESSLPEPAAVALDYLYYVRRIQPGATGNKTEELTVMVVDLGHGSLDLAVVTATDQAGEKPYQVHSYDSTARPLGGIDFDYALEDHIRELVRKHCEWNKAFTETQEEEIRKEAKRIKHALSEKENEELELDFITDDGKTQPPPVTRKDFEELTRDILNQVLELTEDQLNKSQNEGIKIDRIILSGGGSHMPMIRKGIEELVNHKFPVEPYRPGEAVSYGAARYARGLPDPDPVPPIPDPDPDPSIHDPQKGNTMLGQYANYSYGLRFEDPLRKEYQVKYLIPFQSELPQTRTISWKSERIDLDLDIRRSNASVKTGEEASLDATVDIVNKTFHGVTPGECKVTMTVDDEHHVSVTCRLEDGTELKHGTGKYGEKRGE